MKEQESNLLECFACVYVCYIYVSMKFYEKHERENKNDEDGIISVFDTKVKVSSKTFSFDPFYVHFLSPLVICMAYVL